MSHNFYIIPLTEFIEKINNNMKPLTIAIFEKKLKTVNMLA